MVVKVNMEPCMQSTNKPDRETRRVRQSRNGDQMSSKRGGGIFQPFGRASSVQHRSASLWLESRHLLRDWLEKPRQGQAGRCTSSHAFSVMPELEFVHR